jgi:hypothetical protein
MLRRVNLLSCYGRSLGAQCFYIQRDSARDRADGGISHTA